MKYLETPVIKLIARKNSGESICLTINYLFNIPVPSVSDYGVVTNTNNTFHSKRMLRKGSFTKTVQHVGVHAHVILNAAPRILL